MKLSYVFFLVSSLFFVSVQAWAQETWNEEGDIEDAEVIIEKDREIELPRANRNFERVPPLPVQKPQINVTYRFVDLSPALSDVSQEIRVLKIKEPPLPELFGNYAKAGFGNYITPYLELFVNNGRSEDYNYGLHFNHLSSRTGPVDGANSGNSNTDLMFNGKYFSKTHTFSAEAGYQRERYHYYGYAPGLELDRDSIKQVFNIGHVQARLQKSVAGAPFTYGMQASFDRIGDRFGASENQLGLNLDMRVYFNEQFGLRLESDSYFMQWQNATATEQGEGISRRLIKFKPYFLYQTIVDGKGLEARAGFNFAFDNDTIQGGNRLHFYPYVRADYHFNEDFDLYAQFEGDMYKTSWLDFTRENPFTASYVGLAHTNKTLGLSAGIRGRLSSAFGFHAGFNADNYKNMYFFVNSAQDSTKFDVVYDNGNTFMLNFFGEINVNAGQDFRASLRADYYNYSTEELPEPWHKPGFRLSMMADYDLYQKILLNTELMVLTGIKGYNAVSNYSTNLDPVIDLSFKADYLFSSRFSTFLQLKNIFAQNYQRYLNYPSRGIMVMLGATYSF